MKNNAENSQRERDLKKREKELKKREKELNKKQKFYPGRNAVLVWDETNVELKPVKVLDDHRLRIRKKEVEINPNRPAHIFTIPVMQLMPNWRAKLFGLLMLPRNLYLRVFSVRSEGEMTHDPSLDHIPADYKMKLEKLLQLKGKAAKADFSQNIMSGMHGKKKWEEYIPWIVFGITEIITILLLSGALEG